MSDARDGSWWSDYFDEVFVDVYRPFLTAEETAVEVEGIVELLALPRGARVLDLGCGWGRHAVGLARAGLELTGLDLSPVLLEHARRHAAGAGVEVEWVEADMREVPFRDSFDAVVSLFSSLGYFLDDAEDVRALRAARDALRPDGLFLLETMHRDHVVREFAERDWWEGESGALVRVEREFDPVAGVSRERLWWRRGEEEREKFHQIRIRSATEWAALLDAAGLEPLGWYGDWDAAPFGPASERLLVLAQRAG